MFFSHIGAEIRISIWLQASTGLDYDEASVGHLIPGSGDLLVGTILPIFAFLPRNYT